MKIKIVICLLILVSFLYSEETVKPKNIDPKYYGIKNIFDYKNGYNDYIGFQNEFFTFINEIRNGKKDISEINKYFPEINYRSVKGLCVHDSILLYLFPEFMEKLIGLLKVYNTNNEANKYETEKLISILSDNNLENLSPYCFSTMQAMKILDNILFLLPNSDWKEMKIGNENSGIYILGDKYASGSVNIYKVKIKKNYDILKDKKLNPAFFIQKEPDEKNLNYYTLSSNVIVKISDAVKIGDFEIKEIYERITVSPDYHKLINFVERTRFYLKDDLLIVVSLTTTIAGFNILSDKENLIYIQGLILDSINFQKD